MSMKLMGLLSSGVQRGREQSYLKGSEDLIVLKGVPCEMDFQAISGWMEHESEKHHYLPLFHLTGRVTGLHGNFPYNVSSISFSEKDMDTNLQKDILYYMTPKELAHMIEVGQFYTDRFQLPEILTRNTYSFPVMVDMTIVPPPNPAAYEQASYERGLSDTAINGIDKDNLPIFYVELTGTGVTRKKDALLDYYGIDFDEDFPVYALTAESSGYTEPTLMEYLTEPVVEAQAEAGPVEDMYITPEEEAAMLRHQQEQQQEILPEYNPQDDYQETAEDILLAQADRNIERRIEEQRRKDLQMSRQQVRGRDLQQPTAQQEDTLSRLSALERMIQQSGRMGVKDMVRSETPKQAESKVIPVREEPVFVQHDVVDKKTMEHAVEEQPVVGQDVTEAAMAGIAREAKQEASPDRPQQYLENQMDFNKEVNTFVHPEADKDNKENQTDGSNLSEDEDDFARLREAQGADVADARLQAKVDEAHAKENARQVAVDIQSDIHEESPRAEESKGSDEKSDGKSDGTTAEKSEDKSQRQTFDDIAEKAEQQNGYDDTLGVSY